MVSPELLLGVDAIGIRAFWGVTTIPASMQLRFNECGVFMFAIISPWRS